MRTTEPPSTSRTGSAADSRADRDPVDPRLVFSSLWIATMFVFAYVDIFGFWRDDVLRGALGGEVPGVGFTIDQTFLTLTTVYILIPSLMVPLSLLLPARANRIAQVVVGGLYAVSIAGGMIGESWAYYLLGSAVEVALLGVLIWRAISWKR